MNETWPILSDLLQRPGVVGTIAAAWLCVAVIARAETNVPAVIGAYLHAFVIGLALGGDGTIVWPPPRYAWIFHGAFLVGHLLAFKWHPPFGERTATATTTAREPRTRERLTYYVCLGLIPIAAAFMTAACWTNAANIGVFATALAMISLSAAWNGATTYHPIHTTHKATMGAHPDVTPAHHQELERAFNARSRLFCVTLALLLLHLAILTFRFAI